MAIKIALVGAGSASFGPCTTRDIYLSDALNADGVELVLMDTVAAHLPERERYARRVAERLDRSARITSTTDLDQALRGAHFVVTAIEVNRYLYWSQDFHVPRQYGFIGNDDSVVEVPAVADKAGVKSQRMAPLPEAITAMLRLQASIQKLLVEAFAEGSRRKLLQTLLMDPTVHSYRNAVALIDEMFRLQRDILPPMEW